MSTRCNVVVRDAAQTIYLYRHSDGYPDGAGSDLTEFVKDYKMGLMRLDAMQSAGWLIVRGHFEDRKVVGPRPTDGGGYVSWKVGAYEPTTELHCDVEYVYVVDLEKCTLTCFEPKANFMSKPRMSNLSVSKEFKAVKFMPLAVDGE